MWGISNEMQLIGKLNCSTHKHIYSSCFITNLVWLTCFFLLCVLLFNQSFADKNNKGGWWKEYPASRQAIFIQVSSILSTILSFKWYIRGTWGFQWNGQLVVQSMAHNECVKWCWWLGGCWVMLKCLNKKLILKPFFCQGCSKSDVCFSFWHFDILAGSFQFFAIPVFWC